MPIAATSTMSFTERFHEMYGSEPLIVRAPGRVNLIGEHTDYNDGFVMPAAIGYYTWVAAAKRNDRVVEAYSERFKEKITLSLDRLSGPPQRHWSDFIRGTAATLQAAAHSLSGIDLLIEGDVPLGAGLSSSASLEMATALAMTSISGVKVDRLELVKLCQKTEHQYVGTLCGIMDQFVSAFGKAGHSLMLDCRSLEYKTLPLPSNVSLVVCNSMVKHELASGEYNRRRADCVRGVEQLRTHFPKVHALRDVEIKDLEAWKEEMEPKVYRRCRHVITENRRVVAAAQALQSGDAERFEHLMYRSHASLRDDYEVSCRELDLLVDLAAASPGVYGARLTGGGFGGCTVNLTRTDAAVPFKSRMERAYYDATGMTPDVYICQPAEGAEAWLGGESVPVRRS
jgi:galactokinase